MSFKLTEQVQKDVETALDSMAVSGADVFGVPNTQGMVLVKKGSSEDLQRSQSGNQLAEYQKGDSVYILCNG